MGEKKGWGTVPGEPTERGRPDRFDDHPTPEELSAYQANELTPEESDAIQEHLAGCRLCTEALLDLHRFLDPPPEDRPRDGVADLETEAEWRTLRAKLPQVERRRPDRRATYAAIAAVLLVAIGFSFYVHSRPGRFQTLEPWNGYRGGPGEVVTVQLPVTLRLKPLASTSFPRYRADLQARAGASVREFPDLEQTPSYNVEIPLDRGDLPPGEYRIELHGIMNGVSTPAGVYAFDVADR